MSDFHSQLFVPTIKLPITDNATGTNKNISIVSSDYKISETSLKSVTWICKEQKSKNSIFIAIDMHIIKHTTI